MNNSSVSCKRGIDNPKITVGYACMNINRLESWVLVFIVSLLSWYFFSWNEQLKFDRAIHTVDVLCVFTRLQIIFEWFTSPFSTSSDHLPSPTFNLLWPLLLCSHPLWICCQGKWGIAKKFWRNPQQKSPNQSSMLAFQATLFGFLIPWLWHKVIKCGYNDP